MQPHLGAVDLPIRSNSSVHAFDRGLRKTQSTSGLRTDQNVFITRLLLINPDPRYNAVHPVSDGSVGVVVEGIHRGRLEALIRLESVPSLPDCGCALGYRV